MVLSLNGLPCATIELKTSSLDSPFDNAKQYVYDREASEAYLSLQEKLGFILP
jgi:hypothetical protein